MSVVQCEYCGVLISDTFPMANHAPDCPETLQKTDAIKERLEVIRQERLNLVVERLKTDYYYRSRPRCAESCIKCRKRTAHHITVYRRTARGSLMHDDVALCKTCKEELENARHP